MYKSKFFFIAVLFWTLNGVTQAQMRERLARSVTKEQVVENYERRRDQLRSLVVETKEKIEDHEQGRKLLENDEEYTLLQKRIGLYEKKLERMNQPMDEREIDRLVQREQMRADRRHTEF